MRCIRTMALLFALAAPALAGAQPVGDVEPPERTARNGLFVELGGNAAIYSLNYERFVHDDVSLRAGFGYISVTASSSDPYSTETAKVSLTLVPLTASYLGLRSRNHVLEVGGGAVYAKVSGKVKNDNAGTEAFGSVSGFIGTAIVGYRYAPIHGGFNFRLAYTPLIGGGEIFNWAGIALGAVF